jgi:rhodanese-related sulfurtransferase
MPTAVLCNTCEKVVRQDIAQYLSKMEYDINTMSKEERKTFNFPDLKKIDFSKVKISKKPKNHTHSLSKVLVKVNLGNEYGDYYIYYFGANSSNKMTPVTFPKGYEKPNGGISKLNKNGDAYVTIRCPQNYIEDGLSNLPHMHIIIINKSKTGFLKKGFTVNVICKLNYQEMKKKVSKNDAILLNALPEKYFAKRSIPNSFNLPTKKAKTMKESDVDLFMKKLIKKVSKVEKAYKEKTISLKQIPIITYCYYPKCSASHKLIELLHNCGYVNIKEYPGGTVEWFETYKNEG